MSSEKEKSFEAGKKNNGVTDDKSGDN